MLLAGKRVLVTGAGGSIGTEIVRQVLDFGPAELLALDNDETHLYEAVLSWNGSADRVPPPSCATSAIWLRPAEGVRRSPSRGGVPRRRPQARADPRGVPRRGHQDQRARDRSTCCRPWRPTAPSGSC